MRSRDTQYNVRAERSTHRRSAPMSALYYIEQREATPIPEATRSRYSRKPERDARPRVIRESQGISTRTVSILGDLHSWTPTKQHATLVHRQSILPGFSGHRDFRVAPYGTI